jgi:predicted ATPase
MRFRLISHVREIPAGVREHAFLKNDNWDDWFKFETAYQLYVADETGVLHEPGTVKIGRFGLQPGSRQIENTRRASLPPEFESLGEEYFSLGQGENYYETLNSLRRDLRVAILTGLRDAAYDIQLFERAANESVMVDSLLRNIDTTTVRLRLSRLAHGDVTLTRFRFGYTLPPGPDALAPPRLEFDVSPSSAPPSNVHVLIGRNGVGKTRCMQGIARAALEKNGGQEGVGVLQDLDGDDERSFAGLVLVAFSAFDMFDLPVQVPSGFRATFVGLRERDPQTGEVHTKTPADLARDFTTSLINCRRGLKAERWLSAVGSLANDPLFAENDPAALLEGDLPEDQWSDRAQHFFTRLSSGHAIVLLTVTRLVDLVDEKTLVLLDEPEGHLHPPLLSAFIRTLADLLTRRNGVAIIATHSPVVLQEVPAACAWVLNRSGQITTAHRPPVETFGENVGTLTREVFSFEVTNTGFHSLVRAAVEQQQFDYDRVIEHFSRQLGMEARAIARSLIVERDSRGTP